MSVTCCCLNRQRKPKTFFSPIAASFLFLPRNHPDTSLANFPLALRVALVFFPLRPCLHCSSTAATLHLLFHQHSSTINPVTVPLNLFLLLCKLFIKYISRVCQFRVWIKSNSITKVCGIRVYDYVVRNCEIFLYLGARLDVRSPYT